jgi:Carboxypeptidase regulatory-like domain
MIPKAIKLNMILLVCGLISIGLAQTNRATVRISGTVFDPNAAVIPFVSVTLKNLADQTTLLARTNDIGAFVFRTVAPGQYELSIESPGFGKHIEMISIENGNHRELRVALTFRQCPDPVKRLSAKVKSAYRFCEVHHKKLRLDTVPISYGLVVLDFDAVNKYYPNSNHVAYGGCVIDCYKKAEVLYCQSCRAAELRRKRGLSGN